ncbi:hypothetical protein CIK06_12940 [Plantactinospora sp. KBS50]|nr:hypothetical protein CIK06_12940 [Plantactinospora sp. KBS50]
MTAAGRRTVTLTDLARIPIRRWPVVALTALIGLAATAGYLWLVPASYEAIAVVAVRPVVADPFSYPGPGADRAVNMNVENGLATGSQVTDAIASAIGRPIGQVRDSLQVELPVGTQVLRFLYTGRSAEEAVTGANTAAQTYLELRRSLYEKQQATVVDAYDAAIKTTTDQRNAARKSLPASGAGSGSNASPGVTATVDQLRSLNDQLSQLAEERARAAAVDVTPGTLTRSAAPPVPSSHDSALLYLVAGLLGGFLVGVVVAFGLESLDRRVRSLAEAEEIIGRPALATVRLRKAADDKTTDLRYAALVLAEQLTARPAPGERRAVLLSTRAGEGQGQLVAGLRAALANEGLSVRMTGVDQAGPLAGGEDDEPEADRPEAWPAENRRPVPAVRPGPNRHTPESPATGRLLLEEAEAEAGPEAEPTEAARPRATAIGTARVPVSGPLPTPASAPASTAGPTRPIRTGSTAVTLVDAPPAATDERGVRAARHGVAVLVVAQDRTRARDLRQLAQRLTLTGARTLGFVFLTGNG